VVSICYKYANPIARNAHYFTSLLCQRFRLKWRLERMVYPCPQITVDKEPLTKRKRFDKEPGKDRQLAAPLQKKGHTHAWPRLD